MANSGSIISPAVTIPKDIFEVLDVPGFDTATVCVSPAINMWARFKPESAVTGLATLGKEELTLSQRQLNSFGIRTLSSSVYGSVPGLVDDLRAGTVRPSFQYVHPQSNEWKRLTDFDGYWHTAPTPITSPYVSPNNKVSVSPSGTAQVYFYVDIPGTTYGLGLKDLRIQSDVNTLKDYYFGILLWNSSYYVAYTQQTKMGEGSAEGLAVDFELLPQTVQTLYATPFFSVYPFTGMNNPGTVCSIYPMEFATTEVVTTLESQLIRVQNEAYIWTDSPNTLHYEVGVVNNTDAAWPWSTEYPYSTIKTNPSSPIGKEWILNYSESVPAHSSQLYDFVVGQLDASDLIFIDLEHMGANNLSDVNIRYRLFNGVGYYHDKIRIRVPGD